MGQHVDELSLLGILWNKNVDNFTRVLCRTHFQLIIFGGVTTFGYRQTILYGYPVKQSFKDRNTTYFILNQSDDVRVRRIG